MRRAAPWPLAVLLLCAAACGGAPQKKSWTLGHDDMERATFLVAVSMYLSSTFCSNPKIRSCYDMDDAKCVRIVGDAVLRAEPFDLKVMSGEEQIQWIEGPGARAIYGALKRNAYPVDPCDKPGSPIVLAGVDVRGPEGALPCVRLKGDETPCTPAPGSK